MKTGAAWRLGTLLALALCPAAEVGCLVEFDETLLFDGGPPPCQSELSCDGDTLVGCGRTIEECLLGCVSQPQAQCRRFAPANGLPAPAQGQGVLLHLSKDAVLDACSGTLDAQPIQGAAFSFKNQTDGPRIGVLQLRGLTVASGATLSVTGSCALAVVADHEIEVAGTLDLRGGANAAYIAGPGGGQGGYIVEAKGCGGGSNSPEGGGELGGGGGGGLGESGGGGGKAPTLGGEGGATCGVEEIEPLAGGSGGGRGGCSEKPCEGAYGGGGGGAVALVAGQRILVPAGGGINAGGGGGEGGTTDKSGGGGGGSGGAILLEAPEMVLDAEAILATGGGGGGGVGTAKPELLRGARGLLGTDAAPGGMGRAGGGPGSSASAGAGQPGGQDATAGGGGGGSYGRIRLNSKTGTVPLPRVHGAASQGALTIQ